MTGDLTVPNWLAALKAGHCLVTNGPLLTHTVDGRGMGETLSLDKPKAVRVVASAVGRHDFQRLQLVRNGKVVHTQPSQRDGDRYSARLVREVTLDEPGWLAVRIDTRTANELGCQLYAHSSPVYVDMAGKRIFDLESARALLRRLEEAQAEIRARGRFSSPQAAAKVLALYEEAYKELTSRVKQRSRTCGQPE